MGFNIKRSIQNWKYGVLTRYIEEPGVYDVIIPDGVVEIGNRAFHNCHNLKRIVIPYGVTKIGDGAFDCCFNLTSIIIPDSVTEIGECAFSWCTDLTDVTIPDSVTEIGAYAFHHCASLPSIAIPSGVTIINENVFCKCESLSHVAIPNGVTLIDNEAFMGCTSLANIDLPASVAEFGCSVFENCASLSSVVIPDGISVIYIDTFSGCSNLTSVVIPDSVTEIRQTAFKGCEKLASIVIPDSVAEIQKSAFEGCKKLTIIASAGSYAHTFARQNGIPFEEKAEIPHVEGNEENEPTVEVQKTVNPDGSYVEAIIDHRNNSGVINEYDAQGNLLRTTYGTFVDRPEIPDVELDEYYAYLEETNGGENADFESWKANRGNDKVKQKTAEEWLEEGKSHYQNKEYESALECYINAAEMNNADAQIRAGVMFYNGLGTQQNYERAFEFMKKSAENGNVSAMSNLAIMYDRGRGTTKDYVCARKWYEAALENGSDNFSAMNNLGYLYFHGLGTDVDYDKAQRYFEQAIEKGCEAAKDNLAALKKKREEESGKNIGGNRNPCVSGQHNEIRWKPKNIMDEVQMMVVSCSSPPIVGTPEENARRVMERIEYFRKNGVPENALYELEGKILMFMPDFVVENFEEFYRFLKEDISSIYITMELLMAKGDFAAAKKIADPLAAYLERHKAALIDGRHCHQNPFESALYIVETQGDLSTESTQDNYTAFLVAYARILQNTKIVRHNQEMFRMAESRKYLKWAQEMSPQNASVWLYLGVSYNDNETLQLQYYKRALQYCYLKDGDYGLTKIYECLAIHYLGKNQLELAAALKELIVALGENPLMLSFLLAKRNVPACRSFRDILRKNDIQIGFSPLVLQTVEILEDPRTGAQKNQAVQATIREIKSVNL